MQTKQTKGAPKVSMNAPLRVKPRNCANVLTLSFTARQGLLLAGSHVSEMRDFAPIKILSKLPPVREISR